MVRAFLLVLVAYATAGIIAVGTGVMLRNQSPIIVVGAADIAATIVIFIFSVIVRNSSMYDPYWSVAPVPIALYWLLQPGSNGFANPRHVLILLRDPRQECRGRQDPRGTCLAHRRDPRDGVIILADWIDRLRTASHRIVLTEDPSPKRIEGHTVLHNSHYQTLSS
ncbi:MAG: hypothetical protein ACLQUY_18235 [Ktedonobacterales bacterium]